MQVTIYVSKLFSQAQQLAIPGQEARWIAKRLVGLFKTGKLVGFSQSPTGDWVKTKIDNVPEKLHIRGVRANIAQDISAHFWRMLSEETR